MEPVAEAIDQAAALFRWACGRAAHRREAVLEYLAERGEASVADARKALLPVERCPHVVDGAGSDGHERLPEAHLVGGDERERVVDLGLRDDASPAKDLADVERWRRRCGRR